MTTTYTKDADTAETRGKSSEEITYCPECDKIMFRDVRPRNVTYKGFTEVVDMPGWYCEDCNEAIFEGLDLEVSGQALRRVKAKAAGVLLPEQVKVIRKKLGLTQKRAGEIVGGGENAFYKYESGEVVLSQAISNLLRVLDADPAGLKVLLPAEDTAKPSDLEVVHESNAAEENNRVYIENLDCQKTYAHPMFKASSLIKGG